MSNALREFQLVYDQDVLFLFGNAERDIFLRLPKQSLSIELFRGAEVVDVIFNDLPPTKLPLGAHLELKVNPEPFRLVTPATSDYFTTLRTKLGWCGSLRN